MQEVRDFLQESGRGIVHHMAELRTKLELPGGRRGVAWLCAIEDQLYIAARSENLGKAIAIQDERITISKNFWGAVLKIGEQPYPIPLTGLSAVKEVIAAARLYSQLQVERTDSYFQGPYLSIPNFQEKRWLLANLKADELLIALLQTATSVELQNPNNESSNAEYKFMLTDQRCGLLAVSELGTSLFLPLIRQTPQIERSLGRANIFCGPQEWKTTVTNANAYEKLGFLIPLQRAARIRKAGMLLRKLNDQAAVDQSTRLLAALHDATDPLDRLIAAWMVEGNDIAAPLHQLMRTATDSRELTVWVTEANFSGEEIDTLLRLCYQNSTTPEEAQWSLQLHRRKRDLSLQSKTDHLTKVAHSLEYVEHLLFANQTQDAQRLLHDILQDLPNEELQQTLPPNDADLTKGQGAPTLQLRALLLLAQAKGSDLNLDSSTLAALTRCQPLYPKRSKALAHCNDPDLQRKGLLIHEILLGSGLKQRETIPPLVPVSLPAEQLDLLRHPVARQNGSLGSLQSWLAEITPPDHSLLQAYCEKLDEIRHPTAFAALQAGCKLLQLEHLHAYISRGDRNIGIRSHEIPQPFLLIGNQHIATNTPFSLNRSEMYAMIGMELAHLRFQHSRITSNELWIGLFNKGSSALGTIASLLPMLRHLPTTWIGKENVYKTAKAIVPLSWLRTIYEVEDEAVLASMVGDNIGKIGESGAGVADKANSIWSTATNWLTPSESSEQQDLNIDTGQILAAHRAMLLSADRVALLLSSDLVSTIRACFLSHSSLLPELVIAEERGLCQILRLQGDEQDVVRKELAVRCAALIAFYLSDEFKQISTTTES